MANRKIVSGILTGLAAGAVIAILFSSKKGRKAGKKMLNKTSRLSDDLKGKFNEFVDQLQGRVQSMLK
jgi:gas vesicle protein